jgi:hypothetical protein
MTHNRRLKVKMYEREIGWNDMDWIHLAQDRDKWQVVVYVHGNFIKFWEFLECLNRCWLVKKYSDSYH